MTDEEQKALENIVIKQGNAYRAKNGGCYMFCGVEKFSDLRDIITAMNTRAEPAKPTSVNNDAFSEAHEKGNLKMLNYLTGKMDIVQPTSGDIETVREALERLLAINKAYRAAISEARRLGAECEEDFKEATRRKLADLIIEEIIAEEQAEAAIKLAGEV